MEENNVATTDTESSTVNNVSAFSLERQDNGIARLKIDVVDETMNVLKAAFITEISQVLKEIKADSSIVGLVVYSGKAILL